MGFGAETTYVVNCLPTGIRTQLRSPVPSKKGYRRAHGIRQDFSIDHQLSLKGGNFQWYVSSESSEWASFLEDVRRFADQPRSTVDPHTLSSSGYRHWHAGAVYRFSQDEVPERTIDSIVGDIERHQMPFGLMPLLHGDELRGDARSYDLALMFRYMPLLLNGGRQTIRFNRAA